MDLPPDPPPSSYLASSEQNRYAHYSTAQRRLSTVKHRLSTVQHRTFASFGSYVFTITTDQSIRTLHLSENHGKRTSSLCLWGVRPSPWRHPPIFIPRAPQAWMGLPFPPRLHPCVRITMGHPICAITVHLTSPIPSSHTAAMLDPPDSTHTISDPPYSDPGGIRQSKRPAPGSTTEVHTTSSSCWAFISSSLSNAE